MYQAIISIILCFFAIFGIIDIIRFVLNRIYERRLKGEYTIFIDQVEEDVDIEYLIRYLESAVIGGGYKLITGITLSAKVEIEQDLYEKLQKEFRNIRKI